MPRRSKEYQERPWDEVKLEMDMMAKQLPDTRRIFLADGDALNLDTDYMIKIVKYLYEKFPNLERISCYATPMNLLKKTPEELQKIWILRKLLHPMNEIEAIEFLLDKLKATKANSEFFGSMKR